MIVGNRPEAIRLAPVIKKLQENQSYWKCEVVITAQHRELLDQVLCTSDIQPDYDLNIMSQGQMIGQVTERAIRGLGEVFTKSAPDFVIVQGDTTTTFCGALAAFYQQIPVGHVEAGLRAEERYNPFPEEMNRRMTTQLSSLHFPPTESAKQNLMREGVSEKDILVSGNTVIDALLSIAARRDTPPPQFENATIGVNDKLILVTMHRRESFGEPIEQVFRVIARIAAQYPNCKVICSVHPNPNVKGKANTILGSSSNVILTDPISYESFVGLLKRAYIAITDSGGLQEEAPSLGIPILVTRTVTERPEAIEAGAALLVGTSEEKIVGETTKLFEDNAHYTSMSRAVNPYGDGNASERIESSLRRLFWPDGGHEPIQEFSWYKK